MATLPRHADATSWLRGSDSESTAAHAAEVTRIRAHFDSVLVELRAAPVSHLSPAQGAIRRSRIAELAAYRDRGVFPHNHDFADGWMPYFVDHRGVACAVAHLLQASGRDDIVERVRRADNNVWVAELAGDREFARWLDESGLTLAEAARIQVPYVETPAEGTSANRVNTTAAIVAGGLGAASVVWNLRSSNGERRGLRAALGLGAGLAGMAVAASRRDAEGGALAAGVATGAIGLASSVLAARAFFGERAPRAEAGTTTEPAREQASVTVAPAVVANGQRLAPGVALHVRF